MRLSLTIKEKSTGRTKNEIVEAVERRSSVAPFILGQEHPAHCRCAKCWHDFQFKWVQGEVIQ